MKLAGKTVLVTGAGGFIGSHLVEALHKKGCDLRAFVRYTSRSSYGWIDTFPENIYEEVYTITGDLKDPDAVRLAVRGCDIVFHLGALIGIPYSYINPRDYVDTNISGTTNILVACHEYKVKRLVHVSTSEVYGTAQYVPIDEKHPKVGQSPYSASKIAADMMVESFHRSFDLPATIIRPFNTYGPRQSRRAVIPTIVSQLLVLKNLFLGSTTGLRDFTYVDDTVKGILKGAEVDKAVGSTINLGTGQEITIADLVEKIAGLLEVDFSLHQEEKRVRPEDSEVQRLVSDNSLARDILGWESKISLKTGLEKTIAWIENNDSDTAVKEYYI